MALSDETKKKLLVGGGVGGLALLAGYFLVRRPQRADVAGPSSPRLPDGSESRGAVDPRQLPMGQTGLPSQPFAHAPAQHHMKRRRNDGGDRDQDRCNERGEYGDKHKKHKRGHG